MKVEYDSDADALYIPIRRGEYKVSEEISDDVIIDLDKNCRIMGVEILGVSDKIEGVLLKQILKAEKVMGRRIHRLARKCGRIPIGARKILIQFRMGTSTNC